MSYYIKRSTFETNEVLFWTDELFRSELPGHPSASKTFPAKPFIRVRRDEAERAATTRE